MSDLSSSHFYTFIPFGVFIASLLGSGHCVGMCGGFVVSVGRTRIGLMRYHLGRLLSYLVLGGMGGVLGKEVFQSPIFQVVPWFSAVILTLGFSAVGISLWRGQSVHFWNVSPRLMKVFQGWIGKGAFTTGMLSVILPCGWLHTFILTAVASQNIGTSLMIMFLFWLGTLPALSAARFALHFLWPSSTKFSSRVSGTFFILIGLMNLGMKILPYYFIHSPHCVH